MGGLSHHILIIYRLSTILLVVQDLFHPPYVWRYIYMIYLMICGHDVCHHHECSCVALSHWPHSRQEHPRASGWITTLPNWDEPFTGSVAGSIYIIYIYYDVKYVILDMYIFIYTHVCISCYSITSCSYYESVLRDGISGTGDPSPSMEYLGGSSHGS